MATKIIISVPENLTPEEQYKVRQLLRDAVAEFATARTPAADYVERRYPASGAYDWMNRTTKVAEVQSRITSAQALLGVMGDMTFFVQQTNHAACTVPCGPDCMGYRK